MIIRMKKDVESMIEVIEKEIMEFIGVTEVYLSQYNIFINPLVPEDADYIEVSVTHKRITEIERATKVLSCQLYTEPDQPKVSLTSKPLDLTDFQTQLNKTEREIRSLSTDLSTKIIALELKVK